MCLIVLGWNVHPKYRLIAAANRDEFYARPTAPAAFWKDAPEVLAGRDLTGGGTWMGVRRSGKFAALTNYRDPASLNPQAPSRGELVSGFLADRTPPDAYLRKIRDAGRPYNGFNLLAGTQDSLCYFSNRNGRVESLEAGIYGLSNRYLDTPWPKVRRIRAAFSSLVSEEKIDSEALFRILSDREMYPDDQLPDTGVPLAWERVLSSVFIVSPDYGTRSSSVLLMDYRGGIRFRERTFVPDGGDVRIEETHDFEIPPP